MYNGSKRKVFIYDDVSENRYIPVGFEVGDSLQETTDFLPTTTRVNDGWKTSVPTTQAFSMTFDAVQLKATAPYVDQGYSLHNIKLLKRERKLLQFKIEVAAGEFIEYFKGYISNIGDAATVGKFITYQVTVLGNGKPTMETNILPTDNWVDMDGVAIVEMNNTKLAII